MSEQVINKSLLKFPLKILTTFLIITLIMFTFSPWDWKIPNTTTFYIFNISVILAFILGYKLAFSNYKYNIEKKIKIEKWLNYSFVISLIAIYPRFLVFHKVTFISPIEIINKIILGIFLPAQAYSDKHAAESIYNTLSNPVALLNMLSVPFIYFTLFTGFYYWEKLGRWQKIAYSIVLISHISLYLSIGTNKGIFDLVIVFPFLLLAKNPNLLKLSKKNFTLKRIVLIFIAITLIFSALNFFTKGNKDRKSDYFYYDSSRNKSVNFDAAILNVIPDSLVDPYISLDSYLTQGYYAVGLAMNMEHLPTYGFGNSFFFTSLGEKILGKNYIVNRTYQHRIEKEHGYSHFGKWHSIYVWLANDFSFYFVPLIIFLIAYFFATAWIDLIVYKNMFSVIMVSLFFIMIFYFPANNQIIGYQGSAMTFILFFILWIKNRRRKRIKW